MDAPCGCSLWEGTGAPCGRVGCSPWEGTVLPVGGEGAPCDGVHVQL